MFLTKLSGMIVFGRAKILAGSTIFAQDAVKWTNILAPERRSVWIGVSYVLLSFAVDTYKERYEKIRKDSCGNSNNGDGNFTHYYER